MGFTQSKWWNWQLGWPTKLLLCATVAGGYVLLKTGEIRLLPIAILFAINVAIVAVFFRNPSANS